MALCWWRSSVLKKLKKILYIQYWGVAEIPIYGIIDSKRYSRSWRGIMSKFKSVGFWFLVFFVLAVGFSTGHWWWLTEKWGTDFFMYGENWLTDAWSDGLAYAKLNAEINPMPYAVLAFLGYGWIYSSIIACVLGIVFFIKLPASFSRWARKNGSVSAAKMTVIVWLLTPFFLLATVTTTKSTLEDAFEDSYEWGGVSSVVFGVNEPLVDLVMGEGSLKVYKEGNSEAAIGIRVLKYDHPTADAEQLLELYIEENKFKPGKYGFGRHLGSVFNPK